MGLHDCCDRKPLLDRDGSCLCHVNFYPERKGRAVALGALHLVKRWPTHVFCALLAVCLLLTALVILILVTAVLTYTPPRHEKCRSLANPEGGAHPLNVYFIKHGLGNWEEDELCHVEATARINQKFNFFLINLLPVEYPTVTKEKTKRHTFDGLLNYYIQLDKWNKNMTSSFGNPESSLRLKLANEVQNIKNIDMNTDDFFFGSRLSNVSSRLNIQNLEFAAKIYALWIYPGIALSPTYFRDFTNLLQFNSKNPQSMKEESSIFFEFEDDFQAVNAPCHSFLDIIIRQISEKPPNMFDRQNVLSRASRIYCKGSKGCPDVRILKAETKRASEPVFCPTIHPHKIPKHRLLYDTP